MTFDTKVAWTPLADHELADHVTSQPEIVRYRRVLAECYRLLTDYATPHCVVKQIADELGGLEAWIASERPHYV